MYYNITMNQLLLQQGNLIGKFGRMELILSIATRKRKITYIDHSMSYTIARNYE
jgi:hypothetical protein